VVLWVELIGGEVPDTRFRIRRRVRAEDPIGLAAPLAYSVEVLADDDPEDLDPAAAALSKSRQWVLTALRAGGDMQTVKQLGDRLAQAGHPLKPRTIQTALGELEAGGLAQGTEEGNGRARYWSPTTPIRMPTAPVTVKRAMVGERAWHDPLVTSWIEASPNPPMEPRISRGSLRRHCPPSVRENRLYEVPVRSGRGSPAEASRSGRCHVWPLHFQGWVSGPRCQPGAILMARREGAG
jgi:hypothetical protein